jgi:hypothetical protein
MRRLLWNIYAWPITVLMLFGMFFELRTLKVLAAADVLLTIPALIALHMHVRDVRFLSAGLWRSFAFVYLAWDLYFNLVLDFGGLGEARFLVVPVFALPLYVALLRYAFRDWTAQCAEQSACT